MRPSATGPAPGVTDDAVRVGVTFVDEEALSASGLELQLGDNEGAYQALFDQINADGGINGRQIEAVYAPIDPTSSTPAEEACVQLTEDEDVFIVIGFFLADAVRCPVATHATAVVGGSMTPELLADAEAPWLTNLADTDFPVAILEAMADAGRTGRHRRRLRQRPRPVRGRGADRSRARRARHRCGRGGHRGCAGR